MLAIHHENEAPADGLACILDYLWHEELEGYKTTSNRHHVFEHLASAANWLNGGAGWTPLEYAYAGDHGLGEGWRAPATCTLPWWRPGPGPGRLADLRYSPLTGYTLDVGTAAEAAGLDCPVSVTTDVWLRLIDDDWAFDCCGREENLALLLGHVAGAYRGKGEDVSARFSWGSGREGLTAIKARFVPGDESPTRLTVMMSGEEGV